MNILPSAPSAAEIYRNDEAQRVYMRLTTNDVYVWYAHSIEGWDTITSPELAQKLERERASYIDSLFVLERVA